MSKQSCPFVKTYVYYKNWAKLFGHTFINTSYAFIPQIIMTGPLDIVNPLRPNKSYPLVSSWFHVTVRSSRANRKPSD